jgi:hypothetical protein
MAEKNPSISPFMSTAIVQGRRRLSDMLQERIVGLPDVESPHHNGLFL